MAFIDAQLTLSDAQVVTVTANSTNVIDLGIGRNIYDGEPVAALLTVDSALTGTTPTMTVAVVTANNAALTSPTTLSSTVLTPAAVTTGSQFVLPIVVGSAALRYVGLTYTMGGTGPSVTVTAELQPLSMIPKPALYASKILVS